jgi:hypothetical protein
LIYAQVALLELSDLSAAFDCVDPDVLLGHLQNKVLVAGTPLQLIASFLNYRSGQVL